MPRPTSESQSELPVLVDVPLLLSSDVLRNRLPIPAYRAYIVITSPEMPPGEIPVPSEIIPRNPDCALAFDVPHDLLDAVLRRNGDRHVHMVHHDMPLENPAFLPGGEFAEPFAGHLPQVVIIVFFLYSGMNTTWYLHSRRVCDKLSSVTDMVFLHCSCFGEPEPM